MTDGCNLCLMLGVQNNNREEVHLRINIQNCTKLAMKTFYFPSMKTIIFEVINEMLLTKKSPSKCLMPMTFSTAVIENLIETINIYGMSIEKFKRTLRLIMVENIYYSPFFFVHQACINAAKVRIGFESPKFSQKVLVAKRQELINEFQNTFKMFGH